MHNPLRSEADMFRLVVIFGVSAAVVIAAALIFSPAAGAIVLAAEVALGAWFTWSRSRGSLPHTVDVTHSDDGVHRLLVVANQTVGGRALLAEIRSHCEGRTSEIRVVVPALTASALEYWSSDVDGALADAHERLDASLGAMKAAGLNATGQVGDHHEPGAAIEDALREFPADEVLISTHPKGKSRWLEDGVVERAEANVPLPVSHVMVDLEGEAA